MNRQELLSSCAEEKSRKKRLTCYMYAYQEIILKNKGNEKKGKKSPRQQSF